MVCEFRWWESDNTLTRLGVGERRSSIVADRPLLIIGGTRMSGITAWELSRPLSGADELGKVALTRKQVHTCICHEKPRARMRARVNLCFSIWCIPPSLTFEAFKMAYDFWFHAGHTRTLKRLQLNASE